MWTGKRLEGKLTMANANQILAALRQLSAYYGKEPSEAQVRVYLDMLNEMDPQVLQHAVRAWIRRSPFFPRVSELLEMERNYKPPALDLLAAQAQALKDDFYCEGRLEPEAWEILATRFEESGRPARAEHTRQNLHRLQAWQRMSPEQRRQTARKNAEKPSTSG
jgi:hypothetical protein